MTAPPAVRLEHVAGGCNRTVGALDWGENGLIAFATHNAIAIYDPQAACSRPILATLQGHTAAVTCLRWFRASYFGTTAISPSAPLALVSGGADGVVRIWLLPSSPSAAPWTLAATLSAHTAPVTSLTLAADPASPGRLLLVTTAGDGNVGLCSAAADGPEALSSSTIWRQDQTLTYGTRIQYCAALAPLPVDPGTTLLALGGVDGRVRLLLRGSAVEAPFRLVCELEGHQNWVRGLDFVRQGTRLLLASASQDRCVRLWTVGREGEINSSSADPLTRLAPRPRFLCAESQRWYAAAAEALLLGHEDWVHSVAWKPQQTGVESDNKEPLCLLSASMDRSMALWVADTATGLWLSAESVGDAGVNHLGYYTGVWAPDGAAVAAHGYTGALHVWCRAPDGGLVPAPAVGGHCGAVVDAAWAADGGALLTVSTDQTARIVTKLESTGAWCEIARPQVHGHDFACVAAIPPTKSEESSSEGRFLFASGSEEKVIRVFEAPRVFYDTLALARGQAGASGVVSAPATPAAFGATLPALGLSNKAVYSAEEAVERDAGAAEPGLGGGEYNAAGPDVAPAAAPSAVAGPPLEEHLAGSTLWPEIHKLYGHGNELYCLAAAPGGQVLASACRAQSAPVAAILLWDTTTWTPRATLQAHTLTVTQLAFSADGAALVSVSRDRSVAVFRRAPGSSTDICDFQLAVHLPKAHARIVWGVAWAPDSTLLATASRDGTAKLWAATHDSLTPLASVKFDEGVHSVAFAPRELPAAGDSGRRWCLAAVGLESGNVVVGVVSWSIGGSGAAAEWAEVWRTPITERHAAAVRRVCWRAAEAGEAYELASCGDDHGVRVFSVDGTAAAAAAAGGAAC